MLGYLQRCLSSGQLIDIIYLDKAGQITQRRLKLHDLKDEQAIAYCYTRHAIRTFTISNILAVTKVNWKKGA